MLSGGKNEESENSGSIEASIILADYEQHIV